MNAQTTQRTGIEKLIHTPTSNNAVLIGTVTLETLGLEVDPVTGKLKEAKTYLL